MLMDALRRSLTTMNITKNHETLHLFVVNWTEWHQLWPVQFANKNCDYANNKNGWNDYWKGIFSPQFANVHVQCSRKTIIMMMYMRNRYTFSSTRGYEYMQRARFINSMYTLTFAAATAVTIVAFIWFVIWPPARWETITKWPLCHSHSNRHLPQTIRFCHLHLEQHATCKHKNMHRQK